jgi:hypothetical protein
MKRVYRYDEAEYAGGLKTVHLTDIDDTHFFAMVDRVAISVISEITRAYVTYYTDSNIDLLVDFLHEATLLEYLSVHTYLEQVDDALSRILDACASHPSLTRLRLTRFNSLRATLSTRLVKLTLNASVIDESWASALRKCPSIRTLCFNSCPGEQFWPLLPACVPRLRKLCMSGLYMQDNVEDNTVRTMLVLLITSSSSLQKLDLMRLNLRAFGAVIRAFNHNSSLQYVALPTWISEEVPFANESIRSVVIASYTCPIESEWLKRNMQFAQQQEEQCKKSLLLLLGMLKIRRAEAGLLRTMDRSLMKCTLAPLVWDTREDVKWRK